MWLAFGHISISGQFLVLQPSSVHLPQCHVFIQTNHWTRLEWQWLSIIDCADILGAQSSQTSVLLSPIDFSGRVQWGCSILHCQNNRWRFNVLFPKKTPVAAADPVGCSGSYCAIIALTGFGQLSLGLSITHKKFQLSFSRFHEHPSRLLTKAWVFASDCLGKCKSLTHLESNIGVLIHPYLQLRASSWQRA